MMPIAIIANARPQASGALVNITDLSIVKNSTTGPVSVYYTLNTDGTLHRPALNGSDQVVAGQWKVSGLSSAYEVRATGGASGGGSFAGTLNTWQALSTTRTWTASSNTVIDQPDENATLLIEIRNASTLVVLASATINLGAGYTSV
jgi:hypothetical protein